MAASPPPDSLSRFSSVPPDLHPARSPSPPSLPALAPLSPSHTAFLHTSTSVPPASIPQSASSPPGPTNDTDNDADAEGDSDPDAPDTSDRAASADLDLDDADSPDGAIDLETFQQILDLDEDDTFDFSRGMVSAYFTQAAATFTKMDDALAARSLPDLSSLGHFLKGSSAALGVARVQASCTRIQHLGTNDARADPADALAEIARVLARVKREYAAAERWLRAWFERNVPGGMGEEE